MAAVRQRSSDSANVPAVYTVHHANATRLQILLPASARSETFTVQLENEPPIPDIRPQGAIGGLYLELTFPPGTLHEMHYRVTLDSLSEHYELSFRVAVE
ncbi:hypothetical protein [Terriglobus roseus]|uniref:hypothetical protein n=1 Tax=Terriglobus roseus TaxID=392734 RepID=UPI0012EAE938|nr:hypothetical protein [Terriglobus roseus]